MILFAWAAGQLRQGLPWSAPWARGAEAAVSSPQTLRLYQWADLSRRDLPPRRLEALAIEVLTSEQAPWRDWCQYGHFNAQMRI